MQKFRKKWSESVSWLRTLFTVSLWSSGGDPKQSPEEMCVFAGFLIPCQKQVDDGSETGKYHLTAVQLKLADPLISHFHKGHIFLWSKWGGTGFVLGVCACFSSFFFLGLGHSDRGTGPPLYRKWVFSVGIHGMPERQHTPTYKEPHTKTTHGRIQRASAELYFHEEGEKRTNLLGSPHPLLSWKGMCPFTSWIKGHRNKRGRSHNFPDSGLGVGVLLSNEKRRHLCSTPLPRHVRTCFLRFLMADLMTSDFTFL